MDTFTPPMAPSIGTEISRQARLIKVPFGDGYRLTAPDGLNFVVGTVDVKWDVLWNYQADAIENFLIAHVGQAFLWQVPGTSAALKWDCESWKRANVYGLEDSISAQFMQRFDLG